MKHQKTYSVFDVKIKTFASTYSVGPVVRTLGTVPSGWTMTASFAFTGAVCIRNPWLFLGAMETELPAGKSSSVFTATCENRCSILIILLRDNLRETRLHV